MDTEIGTRKCQEYDEKHLQNGLVSFYYKMYLSANKCTCYFWYTFSIYLPFFATSRLSLLLGRRDRMPVVGFTTTYAISAYHQ